MLKEYLVFLEEAQKRDHKRLGKELELFSIIQAVGGGLPVWLPKGALLRRTVEDYMRRENLKRDYVEVITPVLGNLDMYRTSGHYPYYKDSQYPPIKMDNDEFLLKPMHCPHHHQIYMWKPRSYRDLPLRMFEFGLVHRYEQSGEISGLSRVRSFTQDDAHIYCTEDQMKDEVRKCVEFILHVAKTFKMDEGISTELSFRDGNEEKYGGNLDVWENAQNKLIEVADEIGLDYKIEEGEAAFYGPKIDFILKDAIGRRWQLGTVQLDYVMTERFELEYKGADNDVHRPVIIHRAILGSLERFMSILIEHFAGNFPFWLAPQQISILPIGEKQYDYCYGLLDKLKKMGYRAEIDVRSEKINRKIAESEQMKVPYALVVGGKELENGTLALREHGVGDLGAKPVDEVLELFASKNEPGS
jgi:threonyl-tRNA synthetase